MSRWDLFVDLPGDSEQDAEMALSITRAYVREATVLAESHGGDRGSMVSIRATGHSVDVDNAIYALERWSGHLVDLNEIRRWRRYRMAAGIRGLGIQRGPGGWHVTVGPWVWTTEVESGWTERR